MKKVIFLAAALAASNFAQAWDFNGCKVTEVVVAAGDNAHVALNCSISPRPACGTADNYFGFDKSTQEGELYLSVILTAFAMDLPITGFVNDSVCPSFQSNVSLLEHLRIKK
jgi:hypothetical protein